jgi:hypothetical protein
MLAYVLFVLLLTDPPPIKEFKERVDQYVELQKKVEAALDPVDESDDAALLVKQKERFAEVLQMARPNAAQGDIFIPAVQPILVTIIKQKLSGPANAQALSMVLDEGNPRGNEPSAVAPVLKANVIYPPGAPLSTVPPSLLLALPELPEEVEYRFVGRHLILHDTETNLIVDFILNVVPTS